MPDWQELVRQCLSRLTLDPAEREEVHAELAGHLQELYESLRAQGLHEEAALSQTCAQIGDWDKLTRQIQTAREKENTMTPRTTRLLLPSLATLLIVPGLHGLADATAIGGRLGRLSLQPRRRNALGDCHFWNLSCFGFFVVLLFVRPFTGILEHGLEANARSVFDNLINEPFGRLGVMAGWVLVPGVCSFIGVQAYLLISRRLTQHGVASH